MSPLAQQLGAWTASAQSSAPDPRKLRKELDLVRRSRGIIVPGRWSRPLSEAIESESDTAMQRDFAALAMIPLRKIWDNPEDDVYDTL